MADTDRIRELNDVLRKTGLGGRTAYVGALAEAPSEEKEAVYTAVREFDHFPEGDDPYGEHDYGAFDLDGRRYSWKIDYYDKALEFGSENPADPSVTERVLSIFYGEDY
jgi:hypothetical protein